MWSSWLIWKQNYKHQNAEPVIKHHTLIHSFNYHKNLDFTNNNNNETSPDLDKLTTPITLANHSNLQQ